jgi:hypothetical protein
LKGVGKRELGKKRIISEYWERLYREKGKGSETIRLASD